MKKVLRSEPVQNLLSWVFSAYLRVSLATMRWRYDGAERLQALVDAPDGFVLAVWHRRLTIGFRVAKLLRHKPRRGLVSLSRDGDFIAKASIRCGFPVIRGSTTKASAPDKAKGGAQAFRQSLKWLKSGGCMIVTPDGPRGPALVLQEGAVMMAKASGLPILLMGVAARPSIELDTWDRGGLPRPFARGALVFDGPHHVSRNATGDALETIRLTLEQRLAAADARAEALVA